MITGGAICPFGEGLGSSRRRRNRCPPRSRVRRGPTGPPRPRSRAEPSVNDSVGQGRPRNEGREVPGVLSTGSRSRRQATNAEVLREIPENPRPISPADRESRLSSRSPAESANGAETGFLATCRQTAGIVRCQSARRLDPPHCRGRFGATAIRTLHQRGMRVPTYSIPQAAASTPAVAQHMN